VTKQQAFKSALEEKYGEDSVEFIEIDDFSSVDSWNRLLQGELFD
jgi:hypothetical protein